MSALIAVGLGLLVTLSICGLFVLAYVYSIVECAKNPNLSGSKKTLWILSLVLLSPPSIPLYAMFHATKAFHKWLAYGYTFILLVVFISMGFFTHYTQVDTLQALQKYQSQPVTFAPSVDTVNSSAFSSSLITLHKELGEMSLLNWKKVDVYSEFNKLLEVMLSDQTIDSDEAKKWLELYNDRTKLHYQAYRMKFTIARMKEKK